MRDLKVPYAMDESGTVVAANAAERGANFQCLECHQPLALRRRQGQRPHFTHLSQALVNCSGESVTHRAAKELLREQVERELKHDNCVYWSVACPGAETACSDRVIFERQAQISTWDCVLVEVVHQTFRFDVAIVSNGSVVYGFEVYFRHAVPENKASGLGVPWMELDAEEILRFGPRIPIGATGSDERCPRCQFMHEQMEMRATDNQQRERAETDYQAESSRVQKTWRNVLADARKAGGWKNGA